MFFYIQKKETDINPNNIIHSQNDEQVLYFINSIKINHPNCDIIQCTNFTTPKIDGVNKIFRHEVDQNKIMESRIYAYSKLNLESPSIFLDTDMLLIKRIPFELFIKQADVFLLKRSFDLEGKIPKIFRGQTYESHLKGTLGNLYPFIGCLVITKNKDFWRDCYSIYKKLGNNYKFWFGDQKILKEIVNKNIYKFAYLNESDFACPPHFISKIKNPFIVHFKGKKSKSLIKEFYNQIYNQVE